MERHQGGELPSVAPNIQSLARRSAVDRRPTGKINLSYQHQEFPHCSSIQCVVVELATASRTNKLCSPQFFQMKTQCGRSYQEFRGNFAGAYSDCAALCKDAQHVQTNRLAQRCEKPCAFLAAYGRGASSLHGNGEPQFECLRCSPGRLATVAVLRASTVTGARVEQARGRAPPGIRSACDRTALPELAAVCWPACELPRGLRQAQPIPYPVAAGPGNVDQAMY